MVSIIEGSAILTDSSYSSLSPGLPRQDFENKEVTFESHITNEHNLWHYLDFIVHLHTKDKTEFTGPESYVYKMITVSQLVLVVHCT